MDRKSKREVEFRWEKCGIRREKEGESEMIKELIVESRNREQLIEVSGLVQKVLQEMEMREGLCVIHVPHTTAGITINENADPDVVRDILSGLDRIVPSGGYRHGEGNSPAHIKASLMGHAVTVIVENNVMRLGTWQGIYLCEFDGPRRRKLWVSLRG